MSSDSATRGRGNREKTRPRGGEQPDAPSADEPLHGSTDAPPYSERCNPLLLSFVSLFLIGFGVWVVSAGERYREEYAQATEGWRVGSTRVVELTLVKEDRNNLGCASDQVISGLRCGHGRDKSETTAVAAGNPQILQPYNTVNNELLLGAGLWTSRDLKGPLPQARFTVICNYHVKGVVKSVSIRFNPADAFAGVGKTVTAGSLTECMIPR
jgi:hypothetical protein